MKRTSRLIGALILSLLSLSYTASATNAPAGSLLPDNVTGFGTTMASSPLDGILPGTDMTDSSSPVPSVKNTSAPAASLTSTPTVSEPMSQTKTGSSKTVNELTVNYALASNGAKYKAVRLSPDKKDEEEISEYFGGTDDAGNVRLNDGAFGEIESASRSVAVGGSGRTFRFKFDLGTKRTGITGIVLKNIQDSYSADPLNNRSFDENKFAVKAGDSETDMKDVPFTLTKKQLGENVFSYDVTLETPEGTEGRYFYIEAGPVENAFVLSLDEIQIFGANDASKPSESKITTPETKDDNTAAYAFLALIFSVSTAAVILYRRKRSAKNFFNE